MTESENFNLYKKKMLEGKMTLQTKEEYLEYKKIPPHIKIIGLEKMAFMMNKLEASQKKSRP